MMMTDSTPSNLLGFSKEMFEEQVDNFDCMLCFNVSRNPLECQNCGQTFCTTCQEEWRKDNGSYLCLKCEGSRMQKLNEFLMEAYSVLKIRCKCTVQFLLKDYPQHEVQCRRPNCKHVEFCGKKAAQDNQVCSATCLLFALASNTQTPQNTLYKQMMALLKKTPNNVTKPSVLFPVVNSVPPFPPITQRSTSIKALDQQVYAPEQAVVANKPISFKWDERNDYKGQNILIENDGKKVILKESAYVFKSVVSNVPFEKGEHYFEIVIDAITENELKIGVVTMNNFNKQNAFCDTTNGYAYYTLGKLRNGSNAHGNDYGVKFKNQGTCGVYLNMNKGLLAFSYNGQNMGKAFETKALSQAPIYASVSLLHCAGFELKSGLNLPQWTSVFR